MQRVTEILDHVQSDIEQILLLLKMDEHDKQNNKENEEKAEIPMGRVWLSKEDLLDQFPDKDNCTRTDLDESANEQLKMFIEGLAYKKPSSEG